MKFVLRTSPSCNIITKSPHFLRNGICKETVLQVTVTVLMYVNKRLKISYLITRHISHIVSVSENKCADI